MKTLLQILRFPKGTPEKYRAAHHLWLALALTALGCGIGMLSLALAATAYLELDCREMFNAYLESNLLLALNLLFPVLLIWLFYFLSRRAWVGFLGAFLPCIGISLGNYFKIRLRSDPLLAADLRLISEAGGIVGNYQLDITWLVWFALGCLVAGLVFALVLMPNGLRGRRERIFGTASCVALIAVAFTSLFLNSQVYRKTDGNPLINPWSDVQVFVSKGCLYPFLYSVRDMFYLPPEGYDTERAEAILSQYAGEDIPEERKVSVMGIMLEAFCDLTDFPALAGQEAVAQVYAPWHELEEQSVSGNLLTNIFAGGTVDSEWGFLTGYSQHDEFRRDTDSYVWYLNDQGYQTFGSHPGHGWFYNRQNVNQYLGFEDYWFTENHYGTLIDPTAAIYHSDPLLVSQLLAQLRDRVQEGPCFSFSVSYQNHGPYEWTYNVAQPLLTPEGSGLPEETCYIWNNYLNGLSETIGAMVELTQGLEAMEEPVVLVLFGDHKPWGGNGNSAYMGMGANLDISTLEGFYQYYSTPYLIWANSAAKQVLGSDFTGEGGDFSPCFLMQELFDRCGWQGPGYMELSRQVRAVTPLVHSQGLFLTGDQIVDTLPQEQYDLIRQFLYVQYFRENNLDPTP